MAKEEINKTITRLRALYVISVIGVFLFVLGITNYGEGKTYSTIWIISGVVGFVMFCAGGILPNFMKDVKKVMCDSGKMAEIDAIGFIIALAGSIIMMLLSITLGATIMAAGGMLWFYPLGAEIREKKAAA